MSIKQLAYVLTSIYQTYGDVDYKTRSLLWNRFLNMSYDDLISKLEEDAYLAINLFPDLKDRILFECGLDEEELEEEEIEHAPI